MCLTLASLYMSRGFNMASTGPAGQKNLVQSICKATVESGLSLNSHRRRGNCSALITGTEALASPTSDIHLHFTLHRFSPYFHWSERKDMGQQSLVTLSLITVLYLGCYYYN